MRSWNGLLVVSVLGLGVGACAEEPDRFVPQLPEGDSVVANEPLSDSVVDHAPPPYERPDALDVGDEVTTDRVVEVGRRSRERFDRLRLAGLVR